MLLGGPRYPDGAGVARGAGGACESIPCSFRMSPARSAGGVFGERAAAAIAAMFILLLLAMSLTSF